MNAPKMTRAGTQSTEEGQINMDNKPLVSALNFVEGILPRRSVTDGQFLDPNDPAIHAITDFTREHPVTVDAERQIDDALNDMIRVGVRALLVYREQRIVGLVTSYDIQGERPIQFLQSSNYRHHRDVRVADIMTPWESLTVLNWEAIQSLRAGELFHLFEQTGLSHLIVIEPDHKGKAIVRALVSRALLARQLTGLLRAG
jgi:CBS-domain-containing membrane protein